MLTLLRRSCGRLAWMTAALALLLAIFQLAIVGTAVSLEGAGDFGRLVDAVPAFVRETIGPALGSFAGMTVLVYFEPLVILLMCLFTTYVASELAGDVESGLVDLLLARPVLRAALVTRSVILMTALPGALVLTMGVTNWIGLVLLAPEGAAWPEPRIVGLMMAHLFAVAWCIGGVALGLSASLSRRSAVLALMTLVVVATDMIHTVAALTGWFPILRWLSPFHYFQGTAIITGTVPAARNMAFLFGVGSAGVAVAYWQFRRRDV